MRIKSKAFVVTTALVMVACGSKGDDKSKSAERIPAENIAGVDAPQYMLVPANQNGGATIKYDGDAAQMEAALAAAKDNQSADASKFISLNGARTISAAVRDDVEVDSLDGSTESFYMPTSCYPGGASAYSYQYQYQYQTTSYYNPGAYYGCRPYYQGANYRVGYGYYGQINYGNQPYNVFYPAHLSYLNNNTYNGYYYNGYVNSPYFAGSYYAGAYNNQLGWGNYAAYPGIYTNGGYGFSGYQQSYQQSSSYSSYGQQGYVPGYPY